ncbi:MAG TPA: lipopolysaccharide biosynthesis protein RfbH [Steroidobacteraceae bacterium]|nr:lipopolysaccharide biosynthesis protein RfbH [Steroidobacteraceae bacterium]
MLLSAGHLIYLHGGRAGQPLLILSPADSDGFVRVAPLLTAGASGHGFGLAMEPGDFAVGGLSGWVRLDRVGWQYIADAEVAGTLKPSALARLHRALCTQEARAYSDIAHCPTEFVPGKTPIPPSGKVIGARELELLVESSLDGWLTTGRFNDAFERKLGEYLGRKHVRTTNSGSSANLLAMTALTSPLLGDRALRSGDEVITVAAGFPTTVNPTLQNGLVPVFVDVTLPTYNIDPERIEAAVSPRTRAIMIAHTLGNPFDLDTVMDVARRHDLWVVEDCCDALGATYRERKVGTYGHIGTLSFYPAHHITMGEGGAVFTDDNDLRRAIESIRDWGRDCYCAPGKDNTCGKRFKWQLGDMPAGYDHKYTYSHLGYNLKITDMQAALGLAQMDRLEGFVESRKRNFRHLYRRLAPLADSLILPAATPHSDPSWFGFPMTLKPQVNATREQLTAFLERHKIGTRLLFAGNLTRQPYFRGRPHRVSGSLENTDLVMARTFWIGVYPGLSEVMLDFAAEKVSEFLRIFGGSNR